MCSCMGTSVRPSLKFVNESETKTKGYKMELPVTLIVKAPNQQIEDQTVHCELSWTIHKLKQHLSEVYPSKPPKHEQKLIYSGKLLGDGVILKDILRQYDGQDTHTVHLVCTPKYTASKVKTTTTTTTTQAETAQSESSNGTRNSTVTTADTQNQDEPNASTDQRVPNMQWYNQFNVQNLQNMPNMDPQMMHMMMMQQAFMQAYYTQYQYMQQNYRNQQSQPAMSDTPAQQEGGAPPPAAAGAQPQQAVPNVAANLQPDEREMNRDWLDVFYILSRTMIFISIVYFYSSPVRCLVVVALALSLYLYQIGFFRNVNINNNNIVQHGVQVGDTPQEAQAPTRLMVLWTFFTTFFASLLPEIPNVV